MVNEVQPQLEAASAESNEQPLIVQTKLSVNKAQPQSEVTSADLEPAHNQQSLIQQVANEVQSQEEAPSAEVEPTIDQNVLIKQMEVLANEIIPQLEAALADLEPEDQIVLIRLKNFYCSLHHLVHFADVMASAAYEAEMAEFDGSPPTHPSLFKKNGKEASTTAMVRKASKVFAAGADKKSGAHGKASLFLKPILKAKYGINSVPIQPFRGHRFNILAHNAKMVYCLRKELVEFLGFNHDNGLTASLLHDLKIPFFNSTNKAYAIMAELYAIPLQRLTEDKSIGIVEMAKAFAEMVSWLEEASLKPQVLLEGTLKEEKGRIHGGWAGQYFRSLDHLGRSSEIKE